MYPIGYKGFCELCLPVGFHKPQKPENLFLNKWLFFSYAGGAHLFLIFVQVIKQQICHQTEERKITLEKFLKHKLGVFQCLGQILLPFQLV